MINYNNGKIYKIEPTNGEEGDIYIGSTTKNYLSQRMTTHRGGYKCFQSGKGPFITSYHLFNKYGVDNCKIVLIELVNVNSKDELLTREAHYIKLLPCVNKQIPLRTYKEYYQDNKEYFQEYFQEYYQDNKDKIKEYSQEYYQENREKKKEYYQDNKDKISEKYKEYYQDNKDKIKEYREANKDKIKEYREANKEKLSEKLCCLNCKNQYTRTNLSRHERTNKHKNALSITDSTDDEAN